MILKNHKPSEQPNTIITEHLKAPEVQWRIPQWFPDLGLDELKNLKKYHDELVKFNKVVNLISPKTLFTADAVHFADSILSSRIVCKKANKNNTMYDIGSGNGFPGLVYGILNLDQKVILLDVDQRKCEFLKHTISTLGLTNVTVENKNIDKFSENTINLAIMRGFAPLPRAMMQLRKIVSSGGTIFHLKSEEWSLEVSQVPSQLCSIWQPILDGEYTIPTLAHKMYVVRTDRIS